MKTKILDCTIRDGGHVNNWEFDDACVRSSYYAALKSGVNYFEVGYRTNESNRGKWGICKDEDLVKVVTPNESCRISIMIDAGKASSDMVCDIEKEKTIVSAIRVAAYPYELNKAFMLIDDFYGKGYEVFLNLMASSELSDKDYELLLKWEGKKNISSVNFADSFGSFLPKDISVQFSKLRNAGFERIGYHAHNNLQMGFANTLQAISENAFCVDASAYGMGRGAGNLPIEVLLSYLVKQYPDKYNPVPYLDIIDRYYLPMSKKFSWGYGLEGLISGIMNIHPYYVRELFSKKHYTIDEIFNAAEYIKKNCPTSYSNKDMKSALENRLFNPSEPKEITEDMWSHIDRNLISVTERDKRIDDFEGKNIHKGRRFLIIANGPTALKYNKEILDFAKNKSCVTVGLNYLKSLYKTDYHAFVSKKRFLKYAPMVPAASVLLLPDYFEDSFIMKNTSNKHMLFPIRESYAEVDPIINNVQQCAFLNVAIAGVLCAYLMGASEIYMAGMDGYLDSDGKEIKYFYNEDDVPESDIASSKLYHGLSHELKRVAEYLELKGVHFTIITPTSHKKYYKNLLEIK